MASDGDIMPAEVQEAFSELSKLERDVAAVEIDTLRQKEYTLAELYERRAKHLAAIPGFWSTVFSHGPEELQAVLSPRDAEIIDAITNFKVERYQIKSGSEGEPRSVRLTFEFDTERCPYFENKSISKEFEFVTREDIPGASGFVSKPVNFKWTKLGRKEGYNTMLDLAEQLYQAETALVSNGKVAIEQKERESLWQYEKLRTELERQDDEEMDLQPSFIDLFGFRGVVRSPSTEKKQANGEAEGDDVDEDDEDDEYALDVEIFPAGEDVVTALAEELWPNVMEYFMQAQAEDDILEEMDDDDEEDEDDAPELVEGGDEADGEFEGFRGHENRPAKKARFA